MTSSACTRSPVAMVAAMVCTMTSWLVRGWPRYFIVMWENSRCPAPAPTLITGSAVP